MAKHQWFGYGRNLFRDKTIWHNGMTYQKWCETMYDGIHGHDAIYYIYIWLYICIGFDVIKSHPQNQLKDWSVLQPTSALHFYSAFYWPGQSSTSMAHLVRTRMILLGVTVWKNIFIYHICIMVIYIYKYACVCVNAWNCATQATQATQAAFDKNHTVATYWRHSPTDLSLKRRW